MRCDERVFRCAPIYAIVLRVLRASLASSRSQLLQHLHTHVRVDPSGQLTNETERDEMCRACIAAQVSVFLVLFLSFATFTIYRAICQYFFGLQKCQHFE